MNNLVYINKNAEIFSNLKNFKPTHTDSAQNIAFDSSHATDKEHQTDKGVKNLFASQILSAQVGIDDASLVANILTVYLDQENRTLLASLTKPLTINEIAKICRIPRSSVYRRTSFLLKNGYLRICGYKKEFGKKTRSAKFEKTIQNITIHISSNTNLVFLEVKNGICQEAGWM